ncbi:MAG: transketolase [Salinivirgaceae bacterium]|nr:MAG: transketolase [Salinivirgaceae bacterium]
MSVKELREIAKTIRINVVNALLNAGSGHLGGSLGLTDIFTALYFHELKYDPKNPKWEQRDRFVLSIGHVAPVLYATLAQAGYFSTSELSSLRKLGSMLQGHPAISHNVPGLETTAGSLGQGLSIAVGMALAAKHQKAGHRIFSILGDGELQEGSVWEAAMAAGHYKLDNLRVIVDRNRVQIDGSTEDVMGVEPLVDKWKAFNWNVLECNGNDMSDILKILNEARELEGKPVVIIAHTKMGAGVPEIEGDYKWHGKAPNKEQANSFIKQIKGV